MEQLVRFLKRVEGKNGIFVDAGFAQGRAKVAIVRIAQGDMDITVRQIEVATNVLAEDWAIKKAASLYPGEEPIYSDCRPAVEMNSPRANWIPREGNKEADKLGNMRGVHEPGHA